VRVRTLAAAVAAAALLGIVAQASAAVDAPNFEQGPAIVEDGLLWRGTSGVSLSGAAGTQLLVPGAEASTVLLEDGWTAAAERTTLELGRTGGPLEPVRALRRCRAGIPESWLEALAGGHLYTIVRASCLGRRPAQANYVVSVRLGVDALEVVGRVPSGAVSLAAAGSRLALTYEGPEKPLGRIWVAVRSKSHAKLLYTVSGPAQEEPRRRTERTELDAAGDVLVTSTFFEPPGPGVAHGWWGNATTRTGRSLGETGRNVASLADGRIAYTTVQAGVEQIDLLDLESGTTRTLVTFPGSAQVEGVAVGKARLAWAQESFGFTPPSTGGNRCVSRVSVGPTELLETALSAPRLPLVVDGVAVAPAVGPPCIEA
jgi:hypothetical protein